MITYLQPKKNIKPSHRKRMADNEFLALFNEVEIDDCFDLKYFTLAEVDFEHVYKKLNLHRKQFKKHLTFRVRKIKSRYIIGRYFYTKQTIIVAANARGMSAFIHELGHLIDYEWRGDGKMLSKQEFFKPLAEAYTANFKALRRVGQRPSYFLDPSEIFARCFELYVVRKFGGLTITAPYDNYTLEGNKAVYPMHNEEVLKLIDYYFDSLFTAEI